jgi:hypothetical protein
MGFYGNRPARLFLQRMLQQWNKSLYHWIEHGVLPLEFKAAYSVGDLLLHLEALEQQAMEKGGVQQVLVDHFAKV